MRAGASRTQFLSRNGHPFASFAELANQIASLPNIAKQKSAPHVAEREQSTWFKILNREYSQKDGREELFERERHSEPVPGWHSCALACTELEENA